MNPGKPAMGSLEDFRAREGQLLFTSAPFSVNAENIQQFCRSVNQMDWFHFDEARATASPFGAIVAPGMYTLSLIHSVYFENVTLQNLKALFLGSDRFRILRPVKAGDTLQLEFTVAKVEERSEGFAVHYDFRWLAQGEEEPVTIGNFIVRYWPE